MIAPAHWFGFRIIGRAFAISVKGGRLAIGRLRRIDWLHDDRYRDAYNGS